MLQLRMSSAPLFFPAITEGREEVEVDADHRRRTRTASAEKRAQRSLEFMISSL
jgi:hypothetical protein